MHAADSAVGSSRVVTQVIVFLACIACAGADYSCPCSIPQAVKCQEDLHRTLPARSQDDAIATREGNDMKRRWIGFSLVMLLSFMVLGWIGTRIYQEMPPIPTKVVTTDGTVLIAEGDVTAGQNVWQ